MATRHRMSVPMNMKGIVSSLLLLLPLTANAGWQVSRPESSAPSGPFFQAGNQRQTVMAHDSYPNLYANLGKSAPTYAISISGSIKENLERIMRRYHWKVIWKSPYDYKFDGKVSGSSLPNVVQKLLEPFPLKAVMYMSNRTITIENRDLKS